MDYRGLAVVILGLTGAWIGAIAVAPAGPAARTDGSGPRDRVAWALAADSIVIYGVQGQKPRLREGGHISVRLRNGTELIRFSNATNYFGVEYHGLEHVFAAFSRDGAQDCGRFPAPCARTGYQLIDLTTGTVMESFSFPVRTSKDSEVHDVERLPSDRQAVIDMDRERLLIVGRDHDTIVWQWNASSYYDAPEDPTRTDWLHMNDVDYIGNDTFLVSVRNRNQLLFIRRGAGVVGVVNHDGDPGLFDHQHNPDLLGPGHIILSDSEGDAVMELRRRDGRWVETWRVGTPEIDINWPRDADRLRGGTTLVTDSYGEQVLAIRQDGSVVWNFSTQGAPYEADLVRDPRR